MGLFVSDPFLVNRKHDATPLVVWHSAGIFCLSRLNSKVFVQIKMLSIFKGSPDIVLFAKDWFDFVVLFNFSSPHFASMGGGNELIFICVSGVIGSRRGVWCNPLLRRFFMKKQTFIKLLGSKKLA